MGVGVRSKEGHDGALEYLSVTIYPDMIHYTFSVLVYSNLGLGFASGCIIIIAEIIYAKMTMPRNLQTGCGTILLLLTLSAVLTTVTSWMITEYYDP